ncbi:hypothetical protein M422DRAFT_251223 [Sphaerobolus stellatus SS14]|uniref:Uncharacterized protein n=1 Tax=Sphaerobolus stellatus (strain SS14) TaxID=990650 RepID=A0A0C9W325_SPHS4|nr:hypothetical protein M422DRAFT_251223 [Sphaerobolus stellatus SS14]
MSTRSGRSYSQKPIHRRSRSVGAIPSPRPLSPLIDNSSPISNVAQPTIIGSGLGGRVSSSRLSSDNVDDEYHSLTRSASPIHGVTAMIAPVIVRSQRHSSKNKSELVDFTAALSFQNGSRASSYDAILDELPAPISYAESTPVVYPNPSVGICIQTPASSPSLSVSAHSMPVA